MKIKNEHLFIPPEGTVYNDVGQLVQTWHKEPAGDKITNFYNDVGQLIYSITPDGVVLNDVGQKTGEIVPHYDDEDNYEELSIIPAKKIIEKLESCLENK